MNPHLKAFQIINTSVKNCPPIHYIFTAIRSMVNIESVFIGQTLIDEIPENAFRPLNGSKNNSTSLYFNGKKITKIGNNAFNHLTYLSCLEFSRNNLIHIPKNVFNFEKFNNNLFELYFLDNYPNSSSFEIGSFDNLNRPTIIYLSNGVKYNNITFLDQHIFEEFLIKNKNKIDVKTIDYKDCRSFWLIDNKNYVNQLTYTFHGS